MFSPFFSPTIAGSPEEDDFWGRLTNTLPFGGGSQGQTVRPPLRLPTGPVPHDQGRDENLWSDSDLPAEGGGGLLERLSRAANATFFPGSSGNQANHEEDEARRRARGNAALALGAALLKHAGNGNFTAALGEGAQEAVRGYRGEMDLFDEKQRRKKQDQLQEETVRAQIDATKSQTKATDATTKRNDDVAAREAQDWTARQEGLSSIVGEAEKLGLDNKDLVNIKLWASSPGTFDKAMAALGSAIDRSRIPEDQARDLKSKIDAMHAGLLPDYNKQQELSEREHGLKVRQVANEERRTSIADRESRQKTTSTLPGGITPAQIQDDIAAEERSLRTLYREEVDKDFENPANISKRIRRGPDGTMEFVKPDYGDADRRAADDARRNVMRRLGASDSGGGGNDMPSSLSSLLGGSAPAIEHARALRNAGFSWERIEQDLRSKVHVRR